jgi:hypothetical protein
MYFFFTWWGQPHVQPPIWRTRHLHLGLHFRSVRRGPYQRLYCRQHCSQDTLPTQTSPLRHSNDTGGGGGGYYSHGADLCFWN